MSDIRKVIYKSGELIDFETVFEENTRMRTGVPAHKGTIERVDYTTSVYEDGKTYPKYCYVYLPYGYDKDDKDKKYNVLYFQHGNTCEPSIFSMGDADQRVLTGMVPAGDGGWEGIKGNYYKEVVEDIIPAVETRFNTYLEDPTPEGIKASRDHRAFSGYSRGGAMTWRMIHYDFEYFRWFCPMSCSTRGDKKRGEALTQEEVIDYVTSPMKEHRELPFFIFASNGGKEDIAEMTNQMKYLTKQDCFSFGKDPAVNNIYFAVSNFYHTDYLVPYYFWNSLQTIFKGV